MKTQEKDPYHGVALAQIVEHESFKALNKASKKYGHYVVNKDIYIFVKYRGNNSSPWIFPFQTDEIRSINKEIKSKPTVFVCLVCGKKTVCTLQSQQVQSVLDLNNPSLQSISVKVPKGGSCRVSGSAGNLKRTIAHNSFPNVIFDLKSSWRRKK